MNISDYPHHCIQATIMRVRVGDDYVVCKARKANAEEEYVTQSYQLLDIIEEKNDTMMVPVNLFSEAMYAYVKEEGTIIQVERSGHIISMSTDKKIEGVESPYNKSGTLYVPFEFVISQLDVDYEYDPDSKGYEVIVETRYNGPRKLMPAEENLPYSKYFTDYWNTPFIERADTLVWAEKCALYAPTNPQRPSKMLHSSDVNRLMDPKYRENEWTEGFTLFEDGSAVMCAKTEMPGVSKEAFLWWFAWHVQEDIRYMLWYPPSHYGISPSLELRQKLANPKMSLLDKTRGGDISHLVYEPITIDSLSYSVAIPVPAVTIRFFDPEYRGFTAENVKRMENEGIAAICGNYGMLHFFVENADGSGGTLYSNFWYGIEQTPEGVWTGMKKGVDESLYPFLMSIAQHANKEFSNLAKILPMIFDEFKD
jgi:hypothetical protein